MVSRPPLPIGTFGKITFLVQASGGVYARAGRPTDRDFPACERVVDVDTSENALQRVRLGAV